MQTPHCPPPQRANDSAICCRRSSGNPSRVTSVLPATCAAFIVQHNRGLPSINSVQQPQEACGSHPFFSDVKPKSSRSTASKERSSTAASTSRPFRVNRTVSLAPDVLSDVTTLAHMHHPISTLHFPVYFSTPRHLEQPKRPRPQCLVIDHPSPHRRFNRTHHNSANRHLGHIPPKRQMPENITIRERGQRNSYL